jgi:hypothetical protein
VVYNWEFIMIVIESTDKILIVNLTHKTDTIILVNVKLGTRLILLKLKSHI